MNNPQCPTCASKSVRIVEAYDFCAGYQLMECPDCGLKFMVTENYEHPDDDSYWDEVNKSIYSNEKVLQEFKRKHKKFNQLIQSKSLENKRLLDIGCGNGIYVNNALVMGFEPTGIEPSEIAIKLGKEMFGVSIVPGYLTKDSDLPKDYGILTAWDVIEHVASPKDFLKICHCHMCKGGILLIETPDESCIFRNLVIALDKLLKPLGKRVMNMVYYPSHRYYFTPASLKKLLEAEGFTQIETHKEHSIYSKSLEKISRYRGISPAKLILLKTIFAIMRIPLFWNKQVVLATKA